MRCLAVLAALSGSGPGCLAPDLRSERAGRNEVLEGEPTRLGKVLGSIERRLERLPMSGRAARQPWRGSYWPAHRDSINASADGSDPPSRKYALAFGTPGVEDAVSQEYGVEQYRTNGMCAGPADCRGQEAGFACGKHRAGSHGRCIPAGDGLCSALARASILLPEPTREVRRGDVVFTPIDIEGLVTLLASETPFRQVGRECPYAYPVLDQLGRAVLPDCRDLDAGTYHLLLANLLGLGGRAFSQDNDGGSVWMTAVSGYDVESLDEVPLDEAYGLVGARHLDGTVLIDATLGPLKPKAVIGLPVLAGQTVRVRAVGEPAGGQLVVSAGGGEREERIDLTAAAEIDWTAGAGESEVLVSATGAASASRVGLALSSVLEDGRPVPWLLDPLAVRLFRVQTSVRYVPYLGVGRADEAARPVRYEYLIELDAQGNVIGGQWLGESRHRYPDVAALPVPRLPPSVAGVRADDVVGLVEDGAAPEGERLDVVIGQRVEPGAWAEHGPYIVGNGPLEAVLTGLDAPTLHVRRGAAPTADRWDCRSAEHLAEPTCVVSGPGPVWIGVEAGGSPADFGLLVRYVVPDSR